MHSSIRDLSVHRFWYLQGPGTSPQWVVRDNCIAFRELPVLLHTALFHSLSQLHGTNRSECSVCLRLMDTCVACSVSLSQTVLRCASPPVFPDSPCGFHWAHWPPVTLCLARPFNSSESISPYQKWNHHEAKKGRKLIHQISSGRSWWTSTQAGSSWMPGWILPSTLKWSFIQSYGISVAGTLNEITDLHQLPLHFPLSNCSLHSSHFSLSLFFSFLPPQGSPQALGPSCRSPQAKTAWAPSLASTGGPASITSNNPSYFLERHAGTDSSWPVNLWEDGPPAAIPSFTAGQAWLTLPGGWASPTPSSNQPSDQNARVLGRLSWLSQTPNPVVLSISISYLPRVNDSISIY